MVVAAPEGIGQTAPFAHVPMVAPEVLMNTPLDAVTVTLIDVYVPGGTARFWPTRLESVCRRVISYDVGVIDTVTFDPEEGVSVIPAMGSVKLRMETPAGGKSYSVMFRFALPALQPVEHPPFFSPLHDPNIRIVADRARTSSAFIARAPGSPSALYGSM
jgi:hypothetical protein